MFTPNGLKSEPWTHRCTAPYKTQLPLYVCCNFAFQQSFYLIFSITWLYGALEKLLPSFANTYKEDRWSREHYQEWSAILCAGLCVLSELCCHWCVLSAMCATARLFSGPVWWDWAGAAES